MGVDAERSRRRGSRPPVPAWWIARACSAARDEMSMPTAPTSRKGASISTCPQLRSPRRAPPALQTLSAVQTSNDATSSEIDDEGRQPAETLLLAAVNIQVPYGGLRLTTNSDGPGSRKHTYVRFTCSPPEHLPTSRLHNVIFELDSDTLRA